MSLQDPHNQNISVSGAASRARSDLECARKRISLPGKERGGKRTHLREVLDAVIESCFRHIVKQIGLLEAGQFLWKWESDLAALVSGFDALPDLAQSGLKELAYFYRRVFDGFLDQGGAEKQIFELMASP